MFEKEEFVINGYNNLPIVGDITYANKYPDYLVIFVHGFKGFKDWGTHNLTASYFAENAIYFLKFNFSHSGVNQNNLSDITDLELFSKNTPTIELFDLEQIISFAAKKFPHLQIVLLGHSRGGALSILQASKDIRVIKLITWASIGAFRNLWKIEDELTWRKRGVKHILNGRTKQEMPLNISLLDDVLQHEQEFNLNNAAKKIIKPWLIIQGTEDAAVKVEVAKEFNKDQPQKSELLIIEGADHVFGAKHPNHSEKLPLYLETVCKASADFTTNTDF